MPAELLPLSSWPRETTDAGSDADACLAVLRTGDDYIIAELPSVSTAQAALRRGLLGARVS
jgi:hypothetical protein